MIVVRRRIVNSRSVGRCVVVVDGTSMVKIGSLRGRGIEAHMYRPLCFCSPGPRGPFLAQGGRRYARLMQW